MGGTAALVGMLISTAASTVMQMRGADKAAKAEEQAAAYNAEMAERESAHRAAEARNQARWAEYRAEIAKQDAEIEKNKKAREVLRLRSAALTRKGITTQGTPSLLADDIVTQGLYDLDLLDYRASKEVYGFKEEASGYESEADFIEAHGKGESQLYRMKGQNARDAAKIRKGSLLVGGVTDMASTYYAYKMRPTVRKG